MIHGPAEASHFRVKVGRYGDRWYTDPLPSCKVAPASEWQGPAFSIVKKGASGSDWTYVALGRAASDIEANPQLYTGGRESVYAQLKNANDHGLQVAAGRGTIVHWWFEDALNGRPFRRIDPKVKLAGIPSESIPEALTYLPAVGAFFDAYQPELVVAEVVCIDRDLNGVGYGCTGDAGLLIQGDVLAADWKSRGASSDHGCYPEEAAQVGGAFPRAQYCIVDDGNGGAKRAPMPAFTGAIVVSVKSEGCRIYPVDIDRARAHYEAMHEWWVHRQDERKTYGRAWPPKIAAPSTPPDVAQPAGEAHPAASSAEIAARGDPHVLAADVQPAPGAAAPGAMTVAGGAGSDGTSGRASPPMGDDTVSPQRGRSPEAPHVRPSATLTDDEARAAYAALDDDTKREVIALRDEHIATEARHGRLVTKAQATKLALGWVAPFAPKLSRAACSSCKAPIHWTVTDKGHAMPIDIEPSVIGNVHLDADGIARVLKAGDAPLYEAPLYVSHFATCPNADQHRKPKPLRFTGEEGPPISEAEANTARGWIEQLSRTHPDDFAAVRQVAKRAADAGVGFNIIAKPTVRRFEIYRGLAALARYSWSDELARDLLSAVTLDDACRQPGITLGQIVGLLDDAQAAAFADLATRLERGAVGYVVTADGVTFPTLAVAGAAT